MADIYTLILIVVLVVVLAIMAVERFLYGEQMQKQQDKVITALLSRNAAEFASSLQTQTVKPTVPIEPADVEVTQASEEVFNRLIKAANGETE